MPCSTVAAARSAGNEHPPETPVGQPRGSESPAGSAPAFPTHRLDSKFSQVERHADATRWFSDEAGIRRSRSHADTLSFILAVELPVRVLAPYGTATELMGPFESTAIPNSLYTGNNLWQ